MVDNDLGILNIIWIWFSSHNDFFLYIGAYMK